MSVEEQKRLLGEVAAIQWLTEEFLYKRGAVLVKNEVEISLTVEDFSDYYILGRLSALS